MVAGGAPPALRNVQGYELEAVCARVCTVETSNREHEQRIRTLEIDGERTRTTIRFWGALVLLGTPLLASFGAWIVIRETAPPAPAAAMRAAIEAAATTASR